jgi:hypothetical protein
MEKETDAFVVWIEGDPDSDAGPALRGRVEHVQTSVRASFGSAEELLRFLAGHRRSHSRREPER